MNQKIIGILLTAVCSLLLAVIIIGNLRKDVKPPQITYSEDSVPVYKKGQDTTVLLADVSAHDEKDGNVTESIVISNIYDFHDGTAKVVYAVRDKSGNIAKRERVITYQGSISAEAVSAQVTDSGVTAGNTGTPATELPSTAEPLTADGQKPAIRLTQTEVTLNKGETFKKMDYIQEVADDKDSESELYRRIQISGSYDINKSGTYELSYSVTDSDGNKSSIEKLMLVVQ